MILGINWANLKEMDFVMILYIVLHRDIGLKSAKDKGFCILGMRNMRVVLN